MPTIPILGLPTSDVVPGQYAQVNFAQGAAGASSGIRKALIIANWTSSDGAGASNTVYGPDTPVTLQSDGDAATLLGKRSEARRAYKRFAKFNNVTPLYVLTVPDAGGTAATGTITFTNAATAAGFARVYVGEEFVDTLISSGDAATAIATAVIANVNSKQDWPVVASSGGTGIVTLTAAQTGVRGNWIRFSARVFGTGVATTVTPTAHGFMTGGVGVDTWTTALTKIIASRFYYIVSADDGGQAGTGLAALETQVSTQAQPASGIRQRIFVGSVDTLANTITLATGVKGNNARVEYINGPSFDCVPVELAAEAAAQYALGEAQSVPECNFNGIGAGGQWGVKAPLNATASTHANLVSALSNGVTPVQFDDKGNTFIVKRVTSYSSTGGQADYRIRDAHKVSICDFFADDLVARGSAAMQKKTIADDPKVGTPIRASNVITPREVTAIATKLAREYADNNLLQNVQATIDGAETLRDASAPTRFVTRVQPTPADILDQQVWYVDQLSFTG